MIIAEKLWIFKFVVSNIYRFWQTS